jgi:hypothetical protein
MNTINSTQETFNELIRLILTGNIDDTKDFCDKDITLSTLKNEKLMYDIILEKGFDGINLLKKSENYPKF